MRFSKLLFLPIFAVFFVIQGCKKDSDTGLLNPSSLAREGDNEDLGTLPFTLGAQLPNPYTVANMQAAFDNISSLFPSAQNPVRITHNYTKVNVRDEVDLSALKRDSTLVFYPYPLDYDLIGDGSYYRFEEGQCDSCVTAQFMSLSVAESLPAGIPFMNLADLYLPEEDANLANYVGNDRVEAFEEALIAEAFRLVGLPVEQTPGSNFAKTTGSKWRPAGRVRVWDDVVNNHVGVEGVEVRARRWFTTVRGLTDVNGNWWADGEFRRDANYSLQWDRRHFSIRSGTYGQAWYNGPKQRGNWNLDLGNGGAQAFYAKVFRAAYQYYYLDIDGLTRPKENNNIFDVQMKIAVYNSDNASTNGQAHPWRRFLGLGNYIKLWNPNRPIKEIHGTAIHELGHTVHWKISSSVSDYYQASDKVTESWARGVQWWLTRKFYSGYKPSYFGDYTGVVEDMIDDDGSFKSYDQVNGYTIAQIEQTLNGQRAWYDWKNNIKNKYNNATEPNLDQLFTYWY